MRRVLHLKMVTQCAMLEDFGMFLVLADKVLFTSDHLYAMLTYIYTGSVCIPYRGSCSLVSAECSYVSNTAEG